jgi:isocitrate/isopropylmalate dehydrogenase
MNDNSSFMLEHLGEHTKVFNLKQSIIQTMKNGVNTFDLGGTASTKEVTREVIKNYREIYDHS